MTFLTLDLTTKKWLLVFLSLLLCWWLFFAPGTCSASGTYQITEEELTQLESNLSQLSSINSKLQMESKTQNTQVTQLQEQLKLLQSQLTALRLESEKQQALLTAANKSLEEFATEEKNKRLKIKAQRNTYFTLLVAATAFAVCR